MLRLVKLLDTPEDIAALAPLITREILYRLLRSDDGWRRQRRCQSGTRSEIETVGAVRCRGLVRIRIVVHRVHVVDGVMMSTRLRHVIREHRRQHVQQRGHERGEQREPAAG